MNSRPILTYVSCCVASLLLASMPSLAAETQGGPSGSIICESCSASADWNPTLVCDDPTSSLAELYSCMIGVSGGCGGFPITTVGSGTTGIGGLVPAEHLQSRNSLDEDGCLVTHHTGNYLVYFLPPAGLEIYREDFSEIDRLRFRENYPEIEWTEVHVNQPELVAEVQEFTEDPSSGVITLTLNDWPVRVQTAWSSTPSELTQALVKAVQDAGFDASYRRSFIVVAEDLRDPELPVGITRVRFESTDPNIVTSEIALEPRSVLDDELTLPVPPPAR